MAQQARLIEAIALGAVDATGVAVASGFARFYQPGTLIAVTVYSDESATTPLSQPVTLDSGGRAEVYALAPCRMIVKKSDDATTVFDGNTTYVTAQQVSIKNAAVNGGAETTLDAALTAIVSSTAYQESSTANARTYTSRLQDEAVTVKDFGAAGDGVQDDTTKIQAALDHCGATGKSLLFPAGTYLISSALAASAYTYKFDIRGDGPKSSVIKQASTTANGLTLSFGGATGHGAEIRGVSFTCSTASSGAAVSITNATGVVLRDVETSLFRTGVDATSATGVVCDHMTVNSTDGNSAAVGIKLGATGRAIGCTLTGSSSLGTAMTMPGDGASAYACSTSGFLNGFSVSGQYCMLDGCSVASPPTTGTCFALGGSFASAVACSATAMPLNTTGFAITATYGTITSCRVAASSTTTTTGYLLSAAGGCVSGSYATGCATGISVGAVADCRWYGNSFVSNTTDISINASATNYSSFANKDAGGTNQVIHSASRINPVSATQAFTASGSFTPNITSTGGIPFTHVTIDTTSGVLALTWGATATTGLTNGDLMEVVVSRLDNSANNMSWVWNAQYVQGNGNSLLNIPLLTAYTAMRFLFRWNSSSSKWVMVHLALSGTID